MNAQQNEGTKLPQTFDAWRVTLAVGGQVFWTDPDEGICSGRRIIAEILSDSGRVESDETVVRLSDNGSMTEAFAGELSPLKPEEVATQTNARAEELESTSTSWDRDEVQFPRLLAEIVATQDKLDMKALAESMDLTLEEVSSLFDRADAAWERMKVEPRPTRDVAVSAETPAKATSDLLDVLTRLVSWADRMGGWDARVWQEAAALVRGRTALDDGSDNRPRAAHVDA